MPFCLSSVVVVVVVVDVTIAVVRQLGQSGDNLTGGSKQSSVSFSSNLMSNSTLKLKRKKIVEKIRRQRAHESVENNNAVDRKYDEYKFLSILCWCAGGIEEEGGSPSEVWLLKEAGAGKMNFAGSRNEDKKV